MERKGHGAQVSMEESLAASGDRFALSSIAFSMSTWTSRVVGTTREAGSDARGTSQIVSCRLHCSNLLFGPHKLGPRRVADREHGRCAWVEDVDYVTCFTVRVCMWSRPATISRAIHAAGSERYSPFQLRYAQDRSDESKTCDRSTSVRGAMIAVRSPVSTHCVVLSRRRLGQKTHMH